jgi:SAM-dependent methyltransferase
MTNALDKNFWDSLWKNNLTGWDLKKISPPLKTFFDQMEDKNISILIPGCGNAYEAKYLLELGFTNITLIDIAPTVVGRLLENLNEYAGRQLSVICGDFFKHTGKYDLIVEQTFFCALDPKLRKDYVQKMKSLLNPNGKLAGLLFDTAFPQGPPFGGSKEEYLTLFSGEMDILKMETAANSVTPRAGNELWMEMKG